MWLPDIVQSVNYSPKGLELLSTFPEGNWYHNANGNRKGDIVVGSALRKSLFQGQPVRQIHVFKANIDFDIIRPSKGYINNCSHLNY